MESEADKTQATLELQTEALLAEVAVGTAQAAKQKKDAKLYTGLTKVEDLVRSLHDTLMEMPETSVSATTGTIVAGVPLRHDYDALRIGQPESIDMVGSYLIGAATRPNLNIDLAVQMPSEMFNSDKDFQDFYYFDKRALYVAQLAAYLRTKAPFTFSDVSITFFRGDVLKPIVVLYAVQKPEDGDSLTEFVRPTGMLSRFTIRLIPTISRDLFPTRKLAPQRNNCKRFIDNSIPTPYYNQLILEDSLMTTHFEALAEVAAQVPAFGQGLSLLKVWATQRGFTARGVGSMFADHDSSSHEINPEAAAEIIASSALPQTKPLRAPSSVPNAPRKPEGTKKKGSAQPALSPKGVQVMYEENPYEDSFNGFLLSMVALYLFRRGKIHSNTPAFKIFHLVLAFLAGHDLVTAPLSIADVPRFSSRLVKHDLLDDDEDDDPESKDQSEKSPDAPALTVFGAAFEVVLVDNTGLLNLAARVSASSFRLLRHEALLGIVYIEGAKTLDSLVAVKTLTSDDMASILGAGALHIVPSQTFATLFMTPLMLASRFDMDCTLTVDLAQIENTVVAESLVQWGQELPLYMDATDASLALVTPPPTGPAPMTTLLFPKNPILPLRAAIARRIYPLAARALGTRAYLINISATQFSSSSVKYRISLLLRAEEAGRLMDKGPLADHISEVNEWRNFWGPKSELRRFHEGTIHECVSWEMPAGQEGFVSCNVLSYILNYNLLKPLLGTKKLQRPLRVQHSGAELIALLKLRGSNETEAQLSNIQTPEANPARKGLPRLAVQPLPSEDPRTISEKINSAFLDLSNTLQEMTDLPLGISSVEGTHPAIRGTDPFPPLPISLKQFRRGQSGSVSVTSAEQAKGTVAEITSQGLMFTPLDVVLTLNYSSKWPNDLLALSRAKTAFLIKIHSLLRDEFKIPSTVTAFHVDVFVQGFVFRLHIAQERESAMIHELFRAEKPLPPLLAQSGMSAREHELVHVIRPRHAALIQAIASRYPIFPSVVHLFRRWLAAHFFDSSSVSVEAAELLVASVFVFPQPFTIPASVIAGFVRVLTRIATHDWKSTPLIVAPFHFYLSDSNAKTFSVTQLDLETELTRDKIEEIYAKFEQRVNGQAACLYIATPHDLESRTFTMASTAGAPTSGNTLVLEPNVPEPWNKSRRLRPLPGPVETTRLRLLAWLTREQIVRLMRNEIDSEVDANNALAWAALFKTPLAEYDAFILIKPSSMSKHEQRKSLFTFKQKRPDPVEPAPVEAKGNSEAKGPRYKLPVDVAGQLSVPEDSEDRSELPEVYAGFDPVQLYLRDIRRAFGAFANFYYDTFGGRLIAVKISRNAGSYTSQGCLTPTATGSKVNRAAMLATLCELGQGVVQGVYSSFDEFINAVRY